MARNTTARCGNTSCSRMEPKLSSFHLRVVTSLLCWCCCCCLLLPVSGQRVSSTLDNLVSFSPPSGQVSSSASLSAVLSSEDALFSSSDVSSSMISSPSDSGSSTSSPDFLTSGDQVISATSHVLSSIDASSTFSSSSSSSSSSPSSSPSSFSSLLPSSAASHFSSPVMSSGEEASSISPSHSVQLGLSSTTESSSLTHSSAEFSSASVNSGSLFDSFSSFMSEPSAVSSVGGDASSISTSKSKQTADVSSVWTSSPEQTADVSSISTSSPEQTADVSSISTSSPEQTADVSSIWTSSPEQTADVSSISPSKSKQTVDVVGSLSSQSDVSGFSESSIQPSMTSDLDSRTLASGSSLTLTSAQSLPDAAFQTKSVLMGTSLTLSELAESSSGVEQTAFSDVSSFDLKSTDVIATDVTSTIEPSSLISLSAIDKFSLTRTTELVSSSSSPEVIHSSSSSEHTATEMSPGVHQTISSLTSPLSETRTSDLGVESTVLGEDSSLEATAPATTKTVDETFSGMPTESFPLTQTTLHGISTTMVQALSSIRASVTTATTTDIHGSSHMDQGSVSQSSVTAQSHSPEMSDMTSDSNFLSFTATASAPESFISQTSSLASEIRSSSDMVTSLVSSDHGTIKSTVSSDTLLSMAGSDTASSGDFHLSSSFKESMEATASLMTSFVSETTLETSHTIFSVQNTAESAGITLSQELQNSATTMVSPIVDTQSIADSAMTSKLFSESSVSLVSDESTHLLSPSVSSSYKATDSSQETKTLSATASKDELQDSSSYSIPVSLTSFASLESFSGSSQTSSLFSSEAKSSMSRPASVTVPIKSPESAHLQTTEMVTQSAVFSSIQSAMSSPIQSAMSSPIQSAMSSPIQSAMPSPIQSAMSSPSQSAMSSPSQSAMSSPSQSAMSSLTQSIISSPLVVEQSHTPLVSSLSSFQSVESVLSSSSTVSSPPAVQSSFASSGFSSGVSLTVSRVSSPYVTSSEIVSSYESVSPGHTAFVSSQSVTDPLVLSTETFLLSTHSSKSSDLSLSYFASVSGNILSSPTVNTESLMNGITSTALGSITISVLTDSSVVSTESVLGSEGFSSQIFSSSLETRGIVSSADISSEGSKVSYQSESIFPTPDLSSVNFSGTSESVTMSMDSLVTHTDFSGVLPSQSSGLSSFTAGVSVLPSEMFTTVTSVLQPQSQSEFNRSVLSSVDYSNPSPSMISTESLLTASHPGLLTTSDNNVKSSGISGDIFTVSSYTPATVINTESMLPTKTSFISAYTSSFESISSFSFGMHTFTSAVSDSLFANASTPMSYVMPSSHSATSSGFIPVDTSYLTPSDSSVFHTASEHSMITSSMQISETETRSSVLFPSSAVPQTSQSSMFFTQSGESTLTVMVPSQSVTLEFSSPSVTAVITPVPSLLPSSDSLFSSDYLFSSVLNQTTMPSSESSPTAMVPSGTSISGSEIHSGTAFVSMYSSGIFQSTFLSFSTPIQTDLSRSEMSFSESTPLTSVFFPSFVSLTAVQSSSSTQPLPLPNASSVTTLFSESVEGSLTLTDVSATPYFSASEMFTSSVSHPESSSVPSVSFTDLTATGSSLLFPSETVAVPTASHLLTSDSEMKTPSLSEILSSTETPFVPSVETFSTSFIPMPSFSTSFFSRESIISSTLAVQSVLSSAVVTSVHSVPSSQSDTFMTVPLQSSVSTQSAVSEPSTPILPFESVSSTGVSSLSMLAPGSMTVSGPTFSSSEIMTSSVSSLNATEMLSSSRLFTTQQPFSDMSLFTSLSEDLMATTLITEASFTVTTATLFTSTEIPASRMESSMQTTDASGLQSNLPNATSVVTFTTMKPSSESVVTSVPESLFSTLSSDSFMSQVSEPSSTLVSLPAATIIPTASTVDVSAEMSSLTMVTDTSTVLETSMETSGFVTSSLSASSQRLTSEMSSFQVSSTSEMSSSVLPSSEISSSLNVTSSQIESTSEILPITSLEVMSSQSTSSVHLVTTSDTVLPSSSQEALPSVTVSDSGAVSSEFSLLSSSSMETVSSSESSGVPEVTTSVVLQPSSVSLDMSSSETSTSLSVSSSVLETSSGIIPTPSFSSSIASSSLPPVPTTSATTESTTTESTTTESTTTESTTTESTTTTTESTTTQSTTNASTSTTVPENLLVVTVIQRRPTDDIQSQAFISDMERGLASAYDLAFQRQRGGGSSSTRRKRSSLWPSSLLPSWTGSAGGSSSSSRRRKRAAVVNDVEVQMREVKSQAASPSTTELVYTVREKGQAVTAQTATQALDTLQVQEVALQLNRVVITKARPASQTGASTGEDDPKLWIIGAVLGPVVFIVLVWIVVCLLVRYRANHTDKLRIETGQSQMLTAKHGGHSREGEVAEDPEYAQATLTQTNGLLKSSPHKAKYEVSTDPDTTATSTGKEDSSTTPTKRGRKLPKKKASLRVAEDTEGDQSSEKVGERSTPPKKKNAKKSSFKETEEMEMNTLDPGFYNSATLQATRQLYAQQTFEEEDEEFLDSVEEERRKNKQRQRLKKKQGNSAAAQAANVDTMQAAYERAQQEIDKVLGPRHDHPASGVSGANAADQQKQRSKRRSKRGQTNEAYSHEDPAAPPAAVLQPSESLEEVKSRVHALLDDAFSLLSNSYTSIGNKVAPASPSKQGPSDDAAKESEPPLAQSPPPANMPAVEEVLDRSMAPKPGEKLHTPLLVDRTYTDYDPDGLITWSPYRAADESTRIVLPEAQVPSTKAPAQEKLQTTIFMESATGSGPHHHYTTTQPSSSQPMVIRTRQPPVSSTPPKTDPPHSTTKQDRRAEKSVTPLGVTAGSDMSYTPYPGLEAYENMLADAATTTTTTHLTADLSTAEESATYRDHAMNGDVHEPEPDPPTHTPPTRDVGTRDERDFISSSVGAGNSAKDLVDSIRQELQSLSHKLPPEDVSKTKRDKLGKSDSTNNHQGVANGVSKPFKKPRKSSYLDST